MSRAAGGEFEELLSAEELQAEEAKEAADADAGAAADRSQRLKQSRRTAAAIALLASGLLVAAALAWALGAEGSRQETGDGADAVSLVGVTSTNIRWKAHPTKCLDVAGTEGGSGLQIWDCDPSYPAQQGFLVPPDGTTGRIKWAKNPELCLDSPGGHALQFWWCDKAPAENLLWTVSPDGKGRIHWASHPEQCVDVPDEKTDNGWKLQVWYCRETTRHGKDSNLRFVTHPVNCEWNDWGEWGPCSASCGGGKHIRTRTVATPAMNGGKECGIDSDESESCHDDPCQSEDDAERDSGSTTTAPAAQLVPVKKVHPVEERRGQGGAPRLPGPLWASLLALGAAAASLAA